MTGTSHVHEASDAYGAHGAGVARIARVVVPRCSSRSRH